MSNIKNNRHRKFDCRLYNDKYLDFMLSKDDVQPVISNNNIDTININLNQKDKKYIVSDSIWEKATPSTTILQNVGYTGVDNGFIKYERDRIGNDEFLDLFTNSKLDLSQHDEQLFLTEVSGNTQMFVYPIEHNEDYTSFKGGFYQGFFKIDGDVYQTLPHRIEKEWNFNFTLRVKDYETPSNILNKRHENNTGIFFYIGCRSENKFWELHKKNPEMEIYKEDVTDDYYTDYDVMDADVVKHQYLVNECKNIFEDGYLLEQNDLTNVNLKDSKGNPVDETNFYEIKTDNKFIIFNRTKNGFTKDTWNDDNEYYITGKTINHNLNYFIYLNRINKGYDKNTINKLIENETEAYDVLKDIENNAFALKINKDGSISYRYLSANCELIEEKSKPNIVHNNEWCNIHLKIKRASIEKTDTCDDIYKQSTMRLYIYVNGHLKLVSKELPELMLKPLNDTPEHQEMIPYCLSIGGGTQGLAERILIDYYNISDYVLPIEKYFGGTFIGDIKNFKFTPHYLDFTTISTIGTKLDR